MAEKANHPPWFDPSLPERQDVVRRDESITADTWDREQAGVMIARNRLS